MNCTHCEIKARTKGMCDKHYQRYRKHGDASIVLKKAEARICVNGCGRTNSHGLCAKCAMKKLHGDRRKLGVCFICGGEKKEQFTRCFECRAKSQQRQKLKRELIRRETI